MKNKHEEKYSAHTNTSIPLDRRTFLKSLGAFGGGIIVYFYCGVPSSMAQREGFRSRGQGEDFNAFLRIGEDGKVSCFTGKIEMGQGIITSLAQMAADELNVTYESIEMIMGDTDLCPWDMGTWGSMTTRFFGPMLRNAAAEAKTILIELASESLNTPADQLAVKDGSVFHKYQIGKKVSYAELAKGKKIERHLKGEPSLEQPSEFTITGRSFPRSDAFEKVRVKPVFIGGGFGGKSAGRQCIETARLAKITGKPVQVAWSREEEFFMTHSGPRP